MEAINGKPREEKYSEFPTALEKYKVVWIHDTYDPSLFETEEYYSDYMSKLVIPSGLVQSRVIRLAKEIYEYYH